MTTLREAIKAEAHSCTTQYQPNKGTNMPSLNTNQFIIGSSINGGTGISIANAPRPHDDKPAAYKEAERLATANPGTEYVVLQIVGKCRSRQVVWA